MRHLLLTADDFGRSSQVNEAVERYFEAGALSQASLMVAEPGAEEAVRIARRHPGLCIGLHLSFCDGASLLGGPFEPSAALAGWKLWRRRENLAGELAAQFGRFHGWDLAPTYWDGHHHLHLHPTVLQESLPLAVRYGFPVTRLVREPGLWSPAALALRAISRAACPRLDAAGIGYAPRVAGLRHTGRNNVATLRRELQRLPEGWSELYLHPGAEPGLPDPAELADLLRAAQIILGDAPAMLASRAVSSASTPVHGPSPSSEF